MNLGDEAILAGIIAPIRASVPAEITVFSRNPADTLERHGVERAVAVRTMTKKESNEVIRDLDVFILGGGGILFDGEVHAFLREAFLAHELGVPVMVYAISAGPLAVRASQQAVQAALNQAAVITVRDRLGYRLLEDVGVTQEIHLTADPAFLLEPEHVPLETLRADGVDFERRLIGISVREPGPAAPDIDPTQYYALLANAADYVIERYAADVLFVPMEKTDLQHSHAVVAHMRNAERAEVLRRQYSARQTLELIGYLEFAIGMRLHFLIFAALRGVPFAALPYASKVTGLLEDLGLDAPPMGRFGIGQLLARIDRSWDERESIRASIKDHVSQLHTRALMNHELLLRLLVERQVLSADTVTTLH